MPVYFAGDEPEPPPEPEAVAELAAGVGLAGAVALVAGAALLPDDEPSCDDALLVESAEVSEWVLAEPL